MSAMVFCCSNVTCRGAHDRCGVQERAWAASQVPSSEYYLVTENLNAWVCMSASVFLFGCDMMA